MSSRGDTEAIRQAVAAGANVRPTDAFSMKTTKVVHRPDDDSCPCRPCTKKYLKKILDRVFR